MARRCRECFKSGRSLKTQSVYLSLADDAMRGKSYLLFINPSLATLLSSSYWAQLGSSRKGLRKARNGKKHASGA